MKNVRGRQWGKMYVWSAQHMELCSTTEEVQIAEVDKQGDKENLHPKLISSIQCKVEQGVFGLYHCCFTYSYLCGMRSAY